MIYPVKSKIAACNAKQAAIFILSFKLHYLQSALYRHAGRHAAVAASLPQAMRHVPIICYFCAFYIKDPNF